jgi:DNA-binding transcriptional MerR regulator/FtsZ-binding cell division protein ZapB
MLQQLELFLDYVVEPIHHSTPAKIVRMPRKLVPPTNIYNENTEEPKNRAILKIEAEKINAGVTKTPKNTSIKPLPELNGSNDQKFAIQKSLPLPLLDNEKPFEFIESEKIDTPIETFDLLDQENNHEKQKSLRKTNKTVKLSDENLTNQNPEIPEDEKLYTKRYYSIGEVASMFKVNTSLIRFWENEFEFIKPHKTGKGDRLFTGDDVKNIQLIYHLLREKKYTIEGAKDYLRNNKKSSEKFEVINQLQQLKQFLLQITVDLKKA